MQCRNGGTGQGGMGGHCWDGGRDADGERRTRRKDRGRQLPNHVILDPPVGNACGLEGSGATSSRARRRIARRACPSMPWKETATSTCTERDRHRRDTDRARQLRRDIIHQCRYNRDMAMITKPLNSRRATSRLLAVVIARTIVIVKAVAHAIYTAFSSTFFDRCVCASACSSAYSRHAILTLVL